MNRRKFIRAGLVLLAALVMFLGGSQQAAHAHGPKPPGQIGQPGGGSPPPGIVHTNGSSGGWG